MSANVFTHISEPKLESLNALQAELTNDPCEWKVDLLCGVYRTDTGDPFIMSAVKKAREILHQDPNWNHEYPSSHLGTKEFRELSTELLLGKKYVTTHEDCIVSMQTLGASGACHMGAAFLARHYDPWKRTKSKRVYIPSETWANHPNVFQYIGIQTTSIPYFSHQIGDIDFDLFRDTLEGLPGQSVILLQVAGNNPTGCDPSLSQWVALAEMFRRRNHFAFFDAAYLGFVSGSPYDDSAPLRIFLEAGIPMLVATTYGKSFGLYGERVGILLIPTSDTETAIKVEKHMKLLARAETGAMPAFGSRIVELILGNSILRNIWEKDVKIISQELRSRRTQLQLALEELGTPGDWSFLTKQRGMFSYMGFTIEQIDILRVMHHVYLQDTGRLSIAGLNSSNIAHVAQSIDKMVRQNAIITDVGRKSDSVTIAIIDEERQELNETEQKLGLLTPLNNVEVQGII